MCSVARRCGSMISSYNTVMSNLVPSEFYLSKNYPDPFCEKTTLKYCVACKTRVTLEVFSSEGTMVRSLIDEVKEAGTYEIEFSAGGGSPAANQGKKWRGDACTLTEGIYVCHLQAGDFTATKTMLLLKHSSI